MLRCLKSNLVAVYPASLSRTRRARISRLQIWPLRKELSCSSFPKPIHVRSFIRSALTDVLTYPFVVALFSQLAAQTKLAVSGMSILISLRQTLMCTA